MPWNEASAAEIVSGSSRMPKVDTTSSAPNGLPSWKVTPWRSLNVHTLASASASQLSARTGRNVRSFSTQARYSQASWAMAIDPVSYIVVGSTATMGGGMPTRMLPPALGCDVGDAVVVASSSPQAASRLPTTVAERPMTEARTSSWRRVIPPLRASVSRWSAYSCWNGESLMLPPDGVDGGQEYASPGGDP